MCVWLRTCVSCVLSVKPANEFFSINMLTHSPTHIHTHTICVGLQVFQILQALRYQHEVCPLTFSLFVVHACACVGMSTCVCVCAHACVLFCARILSLMHLPLHKHTRTPHTHTRTIIHSYMYTRRLYRAAKSFQRVLRTH